MAWELSKLKASLDEGKLPDRFFIIRGGGPANKRTAFTTLLQDKGIRRPLFAAMNSRA